MLHCVLKLILACCTFCNHTICGGWWYCPYIYNSWDSGIEQDSIGVGTLNGVIFYANIVYANRSTFLPFSVPNLITVFLAWINLDPGLDVCFFNGLDAQGKTWLQMAYPLFNIVVVSCVILLSRTSL